ncbi:mannose-1-phosphate guanyltransferase [Candidatus Saccharibacteria bacterium oral taxon 955]|nr:mannose-1-phosphate guanyltransferase [Candidatus Saccharibacteria bacterium oral taxon 955]QJU06244.1 mannose-1-phosphate guanyltransferase [Candidatus Saccharibacteria bacterium oral taxon 955]
MITVIIAGGSGTRLWPLSTSAKPKQLLKLVNDYTMVQNTYNRATTFSKEIYVVPDESLVKLLKQQLPVLDDEHIISEPGRRGTANCIIAALAHIAKNHPDHDEPIAFISADHQVRDVEGFGRSFIKAGEASKALKEIALIGIEPTFPATGFGYIERGAETSQESVYEVKSFKEKPDFDTARKYMHAGNYLWNCGYFVGSVNTFLQAMKSSSPALLERYEALMGLDDSTKEYIDTYQSFESDSIDYALIEKAKKLVVTPATFDWMDVGNFKDLHDVNEQDEIGNYICGDKVHMIEVENAYVRNEEEKDIAIIGLDNVVVVNTPDGLLVARKDLAPKVGDIAKKIQS